MKLFIDTRLRVAQAPQGLVLHLEPGALRQPLQLDLLLQAPKELLPLSLGDPRVP